MQLFQTEYFLHLQNNFVIMNPETVKDPWQLCAFPLLKKPEGNWVLRAHPCWVWATEQKSHVLWYKQWSWHRKTSVLQWGKLPLWKKKRTWGTLPYQTFFTSSKFRFSLQVEYKMLVVRKLILLKDSSQGSPDSRASSHSGALLLKSLVLVLNHRASKKGGFPSTFKNVAVFQVLE